MAWNQPGNGDNKDPWSGKPRQQPPDLQQAIQQLFRQLKKLLGIAGGSLQPAGNSFKQFKVSAIIALLFGLSLLLWVLSGIFIVDPAERAVVLRFGEYVSTAGPGLHWLPRFIESEYIVNEQNIETYSYDAQMLTEDANIVSVSLAVQYRIDDARAYLFNVVDPEQSLQQATASALRQVVGRTPLDDILTSGREQVRQQVQAQIMKILSLYHTGILVTDVAMQPAKAPDAVKDAFDDAIKAQEDEQRFENQAQAYAMQVEPIAKGQAQRLLEDAQAYRQQVVLHAQGDTARFLALLPEYQKSPQVTRERLYLDTMEQVMANNNKVMIDTNTNGMFYLPIDKLFRQDSQTTSIVPLAPVASTNSVAAATSAAPATNNTTDGAAGVPNTQSIYPAGEGY